MANTNLDASLKVTGEALLISDLHLCTERPNITEAFLDFLNKTARQAQHLFILGDLFEYWAGDDAIAEPWLQTLCQTLASLTQTNVYFMHGNRDFLIGQQFAGACDLAILPDPVLIDHQGTKILLSHGDALCTDDTAYQTMRSQFRQQDWQKQFLNQTLTARKAQIEQIRAQSESAKAEKSMMIMDVNDDAVASLIREYDYPPVLIHGHTHRPDRHAINTDGRAGIRYVLGDWYEQGSYLRISDDSTISSQTLVSV